LSLNESPPLSVNIVIIQSKETLNIVTKNEMVPSALSCIPYCIKVQ